MQKILSNKSPFLVAISVVAVLVLSLSLSVVLTQQITDTRPQATSQNPRCIRPFPYESCKKFDPVNNKLPDRPIYMLIGNNRNLYQDPACTQVIRNVASYCGFLDLTCNQYGGTCKQTCGPGEFNLTQFEPKMQCYNKNNCCIKILNIPTPTPTLADTQPPTTPPAATNTPAPISVTEQPSNTPAPSPLDPTISPVQSCRADFNGNGDVDIQDFQVFIDEFPKVCRTVNPTNIPECRTDDDCYRIPSDPNIDNNSLPSRRLRCLNGKCVQLFPTVPNKPVKGGDGGERGDDDD